MKSKYPEVIWSVLMFVASFVIPFAYSASDDTELNPNQPRPRIAICHKGQTIEVDENAVGRHLAHGDTLGSCEITPIQNK